MKFHITLAAAVLLIASVAAAESAALPKTKIGILDLQNQFHQYMKRLYETGNVPILKSEGWDRIHYFKKYNPKGIVVYAMVGQDFDMKTEVPEEAAKRRWGNYLSPTLLKMSPSDKKLIDYVEVSPNMKVPSTVEEGKWWSRYAAVLCDLVGKAGFHPMIVTSGVGGLPCGNESELPVLDAMIPALRAAHKYGGGWSYHGYSCYYTTDPEMESYYSLRYRRAYDYFKAHAPDLTDLPLALSEGGIDYYGDSRRDGYAYRGTREQYAKWLQWYDSEIKKDPYVLGVTLFKAAGWGWEAFDLEPMAPYLLAYYKTGATEIPEPATKMGLALDQVEASDPSVRGALASACPMLYTKSDQVKPAGAVEVYKQANPNGKVIIDVRAPLPDEKASPDAAKAARDRWDEVSRTISAWPAAQRKLVDYLDTSPGPVVIRRDRETPSADYYDEYLKTLTKLVVESGFKPVIETFNTSTIPADGRDWDTLGPRFWDVWKACKDAGGIAIVKVDCAYPSTDRNSPSSSLLFAYTGIYRSLLRLEPDMFGVPIVLVAERLNLPRSADPQSRAKLQKRKEWLEWYDKEVCGDPDVMAVLLKLDVDEHPTAGQKSVLEWYAKYQERKKDR